jgi:glutathione S-transferase
VAGADVGPLLRVLCAGADAKDVGDRLRVAGQKDPPGIEQAIGQLKLAYDVIESAMAGRTWALGQDFTLADCAAAPALFYADLVAPFSGNHQGVSAYLDRLMAMDSFARPPGRRTLFRDVST